MIERQAFLDGVWDTWLKLRESEKELGRVCYYPASDKLDEAINDHHHGCPYPLAAYDDTYRSSLKWQGQNRLWCYPADYMANPKQLDVSLDGVNRFPVACMGTMFWFTYNAIKHNGMEEVFSNSQLLDLQTDCMTDFSEGLGTGAKKMGIATGYHFDVNQIKPGDLLCIRENKKGFHWCIAFPDVKKLLEQGGWPNENDSAYVTVDGRKAVSTIGASPQAIGATGQVGWDYYMTYTEDGTRDYLVVTTGV